jgi:hypothetical protein
MPHPIPADWRSAVRSILKRGGMSCIVRKSARSDWRDMFPDQGYDYQIFDALATALDDNTLIGQYPIPGMKEPGTTYEFIFQHESRLVYTKINLLPDKRVIIIYSTHRPLKGNTL